MNVIISPIVLTSAGLGAAGLFFFSSNSMLWAVSFAALAVAIWIAGGRKAYPILLWVIAFFWLAVAGDLGAADLNGLGIGDSMLGHYRDLAILYSLCAMLALALGMRAGIWLGRATFGSHGDPADAAFETRHRLNLNKLLVCYGGSLVFGNVISVLAWSQPSVTQPLLAFDLIHFVFLFLIAATVFERRRGYLWLLLVTAAAMATGMIGYWASYKEPVFVVILALASSRRKITAAEWAIGFVGFVAVVWISLVWTVIKAEYRAEIFPLPVAERVSWLSTRYLDSPINYAEASVALLKRVGYTKLFSLVLTEADSGMLHKDPNFYLAAVEHIVAPRLFFPNKAKLDDSKITDKLVGGHIDSQTSIGVGYVTEAYVDFGFPGLLLPLAVIGIILGGVAQYFMTRRLSLVVCQAFGTAVLFNAFRFETDIDKALGIFVTSVIAMGIVAKFAYPPIMQWLGDPGARRAAGGASLRWATSSRMRS